MEQNEGNVLIAEFMKRTFQAYKLNKSYEERFETFAECEQFIIENELVDYYPEIGWKQGVGNYSDVWDSLMPCVERIEDMGYEVKINFKVCFITTDIEKAFIGKTKIEATWKAVIEFIKWLNTKQKPSPPPKAGYKK